MPRGRPKRDWVKMWVQGCLRGSLNYQLTLEQQAIWFKLIMMSAVYCKDPGIISDNDGRPMPHEFIAHELHCPVELLEQTLKKCTEEGRIKENSNGIAIVNFNEYQFTEYDRQKPYRDRKKQEGRPDEGDPDRFVKGKYSHLVKH